MSRVSVGKLAGPVITSGLLALSYSGSAAADYALNLQTPVTPIGHEIFALHNLILMICLIIFVVVFSAMFYSVYAHRKSRGHKAATFHESTTIEIVWTAIPFLILVGMAVPSTATLLKMEDTKTDADLVVRITGHQWKWQYQYPDQDISFFSNLATSSDQIHNKAAKGEHYLLEVDNPMVVPVGKKVRFVITASDVIHSWWVPQFGVKKDAIPGFVNEAWTRVDQPGTYRGQCAELCGKDHGFMPIVVEAVSNEDFDRWISVKKAQMLAAAADVNKQWTKAELMDKGQKVYASAGCVGCHGPAGAGMAGLFPALTGSKIATGPAADHIKTVLHGRSTGKFGGGAMPPFAAQLNDVDVAAVVTYERNALGNSTGDTVLPAQVKALR